MEHLSAEEIARRRRDMEQLGHQLFSKHRGKRLNMVVGFPTTKLEDGRFQNIEPGMSNWIFSPGMPCRIIGMIEPVWDADGWWDSTYIVQLTRQHVGRRMYLSGPDTVIECDTFAMRGFSYHESSPVGAAPTWVSSDLLNLTEAEAQ
jgi:hypothetical protein